jgi:long-chain acyl-CoA synthetase
VITRTEALARLTAPGEPHELIETIARGEKVRVFANAPPTLRALYAAARSDQTFLVYEAERMSYEETWRAACRLATALREDFGVRAGDRVAISMRNYPEWVIAFMAATSIGAIAVAMNALWQPAEMDYGLRNSGASVLFADQERLDRLAACEEIAPGLKVIAVRSSTLSVPGARRYEDVMARPEALEFPCEDVAPDDDAIMLYTSGSTGHPKGAVSSHRNIISALLSWELDYQAGVLIGVVAPPTEGAPQAATLLGIPLFHVSGLHAVLLASYRPGRRVISMYKWDPETAARLIEEERVTTFTAPAAMTGDLVEVARRTSRDLSTLLSVGGGGAPRAPDQVRAIDGAFTNARPQTGWGMTETNAIGVGIGGQDYVDHPESSGRVSAVLDIRIVGEDGRVLGPMERGELQIRGASIMRGYWLRPEANAETFVDGWLRTGDVAYVDAEGYVYIVDRIKDLVIRGGENIGCGAVEAALLEHPDILEASAYGVPDERLGEELGATLYTRRPMSEAEVRTFLESRLARFQIPRYVHFEAEPLPRIASGKILKRQLRQEAITRLEASVGAIQAAK